MKTLLSFFVLSFAVAYTAEASLLYRGRLTQGTDTATTFDDASAYTMTFNLYSQPQGGTALYSVTTNNVPIRKDGGFEVLLNGDALDSALDNDARTVYVGLALAGERELMPRRQILALPNVLQAKVADAPGYTPHVGALTASTLTAKTTAATTLVATGTLATADANDSLAIRAPALAASDSLDVRGKKLSVLGDGMTLVNDRASVAAGTTLATAPADGLAYVYTMTSASVPVVGGVTRFCQKGEAIVAPVTVGTDEKYAVRFHSFLTR